MNDMSIEERVKEIIKRQLAVNDQMADAIGVDAHMAHDLGFDSLDTVEVAIAIEDKFDLELPDEELEEAKTVQQLIDLVKAKVPA
jgi:acyl carrier protein